MGSLAGSQFVQRSLQSPLGRYQILTLECSRGTESAESLGRATGQDTNSAEKQDLGDKHSGCFGFALILE